MSDGWRVFFFFSRYYLRGVAFKSHHNNATNSLPIMAVGPTCYIYRVVLLGRFVGSWPILGAHTRRDRIHTYQKEDSTPPGESFILKTILFWDNFLAGHRVTRALYHHRQ